MSNSEGSINKILSRLNGEMGRALIRTFMARAVAALGTLVFAVVVGRLYGPTGVGVYALAQSLLLGAGILSRRGMDNALMRYVGQDHHSPYILTYLRWACRQSLIVSCLAGIVLWVGRHWFESIFEAQQLSVVLIGISIAVPAYTFGFLLSGFFKGIRKPATACLLENGSVALIAGAIMLLWNQYDSSAGLATVGYSYCLAAGLVAIQGSYQLWRWCHRQPWWQMSGYDLDQVVNLPQFNATSRAFFVYNLSGFMQSVLGVMIAGWLLTSSELGLFKSAQQTAVLIGFILIVINAIFPPRFAALYHQGNIEALARLAKQGVLVSLLVAFPLLFVCLLFPVWVLSWFGEGFQSGAPLLQIIAIAQLVNVATGSVGFLLNMTGHERLMRNIALICNVLGLLAFFAFIPLWGKLGAAWALAFVLVVQNLTALLFVWRKLGIWTLPGPNVLRWLGIKTEVG